MRRHCAMIAACLTLLALGATSASAQEQYLGQKAKSAKAFLKAEIGCTEIEHGPKEKPSDDTAGCAVKNRTLFVVVRDGKVHAFGIKWASGADFAVAAMDVGLKYGPPDKVNHALNTRFFFTDRDGEALGYGVGVNEDENVIIWTYEY